MSKLFINHDRIDRSQHCKAKTAKIQRITNSYIKDASLGLFSSNIHMDAGSKCLKSKSKTISFENETYL